NQTPPLISEFCTPVIRFLIPSVCVITYPHLFPSFCFSFVSPPANLLQVLTSCSSSLTCLSTFQHNPTHHLIPEG
ncbi:hypothetical protein CRENBAI_005351, partial [Crenichthys baileyi]